MPSPLTATATAVYSAFSWRRYQKRGYVFGYISHFEGMETGDICARVVEGRVNKVAVVPVDEEGVPRGRPGEIQPEVILRELPFKVRIWLSAGET